MELSPFRWLHNNSAWSQFALIPFTVQPFRTSLTGLEWLAPWVLLMPPPPVDMEYHAVFGFPAVSTRAPGLLAQHLPGLIEAPLTIHGTLASNDPAPAGNGVADDSSNPAGWSAPHQDLARSRPHTCMTTSLKLCEQHEPLASAPRCGNNWHNVTKGGHLAYLLLQELGKNGATHNAWWMPRLCRRLDPVPLDPKRTPPS